MKASGVSIQKWKQAISAHLDKRYMHVITVMDGTVRPRRFLGSSFDLGEAEMNDNDVVEVQDSDLANAFSVMVPDIGKIFPVKGSTDISRRFLRVLLDEIKQHDVPDDHSVGICSCGIKGAIESIEQILRGVCRRCEKNPATHKTALFGGDNPLGEWYLADVCKPCLDKVGFSTVEEMMAKDKDKLSKRSHIQTHDWEPGENLHPMVCRICGRSKREH